MFECTATRRLLEALIGLGASLHHPLEDEARRALRAYEALDTFEAQSRITHALLPALVRLVERITRRALARRDARLALPAPPAGRRAGLEGLDARLAAGYSSLKAVRGQSRTACFLEDDPMPKTKPSAEDEVATPTSWPEAWALLADQGRMERQAAAIKADADAYQARAAARMAPVLARIEQTQAALELFAEAHADELPQGQRSWKSDYGTIGWRWLPPALIRIGRLTWAEVLARLKKYKVWGAIITKEDLDRRRLLADREAFPEDRLKKFGLHRREEQEEEQFVAEPAQSLAGPA